MAYTIATVPAVVDALRTFVNSADFDAGTDAWTSLAGYERWARDAGFPYTLRAEADLEALRRLRDALRGLLAANAGEGSAADAWASAAASFPKVRLSIELTRGRLVLRAARSGLQGAIDWVAACVYEAQARGTWKRVKACRNADCRWAFFDRSKNVSAGWCSMAVCGNRTKARRRRQRERRSPAP